MSDIQSRVHVDTDGRMIFERVQDVQPILDANKAEQAHGTHETRWGRKVASIPHVIIEKWLNEEGFNLLTLSGPDLTRIIERKRRDPDWRHLFTR